jgi:hypothetical protein
LVPPPPGTDQDLTLNGSIVFALLDVVPPALV